MNRTQGVDTILYWPDSVLVLNSNLDIMELNNANESLQVFQNYPNPVADQTTISLYIPEKDRVNIMITDLMDRVLYNSDKVLEKGTHYFRFTPGSGNLFFFIAQWRGTSCSIKILKTINNSNKTSKLEHLAYDISSVPLKAVKNIQEFPFSIGDKLLYIGYANGLQSGLLDAPAENKTHSFQFAVNVPCPGIPTVNYVICYFTIFTDLTCWFDLSDKVRM